MSNLRDEIRAILHEELAALRADLPHARLPERVHLSSNADLDRFAQDLVTRVQNDHEFAAAILSGAQRFELSGGLPMHAAPAHAHSPQITTGPTQPARSKTAELLKNLVTERDIEALETGAKVLRVPKQCRLTPLANDEARRRGIRIERIAS